MILPLLILEPIEKPLTALLEWLHASVGLHLGVVDRRAHDHRPDRCSLPLTVRQIHSMQRLQATRRR